MHLSRKTTRVHTYRSSALERNQSSQLDTSQRWRRSDGRRCSQSVSWSRKLTSQPLWGKLKQQKWPHCTWQEYNFTFYSDRKQELQHGSPLWCHGDLQLLRWSACLCRSQSLQITRDEYKNTVKSTASQNSQNKSLCQYQASAAYS